MPKNKMNRYERLIEAIFFRYYKKRAKEVAFSREDIRE